MTIVFVHGLGQTPASWVETIHHLPKQESIVCPHLFELVQGEEVTYERLYEAFTAYCHQLKAPIHLCGISLGAILALHYAIDFPRKVSSLVLIAPQYKMLRMLLQWQSRVLQCLPRKYFLRSGVEKTTMIQLSRSMQHLNFEEDLNNITCPVLVLCGTKDYINRKACKEIGKRLRNAETCLINRAGHEVNQQSPQALAKVLRAFYKKTI